MRLRYHTVPWTCQPVDSKIRDRFILPPNAPTSPEENKSVPIFADPSFNYEIARAVGTRACLVGLIGGGKEYKINNPLEKHCHGLQGDAQSAADQLSDEGQSAGT
jgi:hypothetical protein